MKELKQMEQYFKKHPNLNAGAHFLIGLGLGVLLTRPFFDPHPIRWGLGLIAAGLAFHLYPLLEKKR